MDSLLLIVGLIVLSLLLLDLLALRFGVDSRTPADDRRDWW